MLIRTIVVALPVLLMGACATDAQFARAEAADFGKPPPSIWRDNARKWLSVELKEPESAVYRTGCPVKVYITETPLTGGPGVSFMGWGAQLQVDAAGRFGGRTGYLPYVAVMMSDGSVVNVAPALDKDGWGGPRFRVVKGQDMSCVAPG